MLVSEDKHMWSSDLVTWWQPEYDDLFTSKCIYRTRMDCLPPRQACRGRALVIHTPADLLVSHTPADLLASHTPADLLVSHTPADLCVGLMYTPADLLVGLMYTPADLLVGHTPADLLVSLMYTLADFRCDCGF
jgi:hypothetical protein